jgi:hypothetical protein
MNWAIINVILMKVTGRKKSPVKKTVTKVKFCFRFQGQLMLAWHVPTNQRGSICVCTCMYAYMWVFVYVRARVYNCLCMYVYYMHVYIHIYMHTHILRNNRCQCDLSWGTTDASVTCHEEQPMPAWLVMCGMKGLSFRTVTFIITTLRIACRH